MILNDRSLKKLEGVHSDLARVVKHAALLGSVAGVSFIVTEGRRTLERQRELVMHGASTTMNSRHLTGHAVDLAVVVTGEVRWDWPLYKRLGELMKQAARELQIPLEWGGDWVSFKDGPHFQLPWDKYPAEV